MVKILEILNEKVKILNNKLILKIINEKVKIIK